MASAAYSALLQPADLCLDTVIWMGDFNYRIGLGADKVKQLIKNGDLDTLYENDQASSCYAPFVPYLLTECS